ncbi:cryptochrome/photolyase family protein [Micromonospora vinacea]|uniref:cryptochrome/photolyase family protein n=1 Tax=Micromonospora vinacea TaxID=709878 RepID=UPI00344EF79E
MSPRRWLLADQLGPHFLDGKDQQVLLIEVKALFRRRRMHRQKAHLMLSALRHRAAELGERALLMRTETFREALARVNEQIEVCHPPSRAALRFARTVDGLAVLPPRGFVTSFEEFADWADGSRRGPLRMAEFYRYARESHGVLADASHAGSASRVLPAARRTVPAPPPIEEDDIDAQVRRDLDQWVSEGIRFIGRDAPRAYPATFAEADARLRHFLEHRLAGYDTREQMSGRNPMVASSGLSSSFNMGLLDPNHAIRQAEAAGTAGTAPWSAVAAFVRQLLGWREFLWQLYWYFEPAYRSPNWLAATKPIPDWFAELDADAVQARCLAGVLGEVRDRGWANQTQRLLVLGNYALQRGWRPAELVDWFQRCFVDGTDWVMNATVIGMSQYADLARIDTRAYAADGRHIETISDYCGACRYHPAHELGDSACPYTAGLTAFVHRNADRLRGTPAPALTAPRLVDVEHRDAVLVQEDKRGDAAP